MNILIIGSRSYPPHIGGIERYVYEFSKVASELGHNITIITQKYKGEKKYEKRENIEIIRGFTIPVRPFDQIFLYLNTLLKKKGDFDVCWGHGLSGTLISHWTPYVYTIHGFTKFRKDKTPPFNLFTELVEDRIVDKTDMNIAVDKKTYKLAKKHNKNTYLVENGIDISRFETDYPDPYDETGDRVLFVGRLEKSKGILDIIKGFEENRSSDMKLHIVGDGLLKEDVKKRTQGSDNIIFHGRVDTVEGYFQHADCYVLPSYHEGFPTTVLEGMAARIPTVVSDLPAFEGNFEHGRETLIFEPGDVDGMMGEIEKVLNDEDLRKKLVKKAYDKVEKEYTWEAQTKKILSLFEKLIDGGIDEQ